MVSSRCIQTNNFKAQLHSLWAHTLWVLHGCPMQFQTICMAHPRSTLMSHRQLCKTCGHRISQTSQNVWPWSGAAGLLCRIVSATSALLTCFVWQKGYPERSWQSPLLSSRALVTLIGGSVNINILFLECRRSHRDLHTNKSLKIKKSHNSKIACGGCAA